MALFFLVVGLEIKRELIVGELASRRRATLPVVAAFGGAILPAIIFLGIVGPDDTHARGWGIPMATDIAFALGALALLGSRIPVGLRVFVAALAIADDLIAVLVIAAFYTAALDLAALLAAGGVLAALVAANRLHVRQPLVYAALGICLWLAVLNSGVHGTVAGVLLAATIPAHSAGSDSASSSLMSRFEHLLTPWAAFVIVPLFALANAGVTLGSELGQMLFDPVVLGIGLGLIVGKQVGITAAALMTVRSGAAALPDDVSWRQIYGAAWLCGIGFTMSLFIADLAYAGTAALDPAKVAILGASLISGGVGFALLRLGPNRSAIR
jgi:NhaA family Na+:H+ antiporter